MAPVPNLNWPTDLFAQANANSTAPLLGQRKAQTDDHLCACGCKLNHRNAVSRVVEEDQYGVRSRRIVWYLSLSCRNKHMGLSNPRHQAARL